MKAEFSGKIKYFGFIRRIISFNSSLIACPEAWISLSVELVYTFTPFKYKLLIVLAIAFIFPGIALDEKITMSSGISLICL